MFSHLVLDSGTLDPSKVRECHTLYTGRNGKSIIRFTPAYAEGSYVFKPLTNPATIGREIWVQEHLLPHLPVSVPRIVASADHGDPERYWTIFEDAGPLRHALRDEEVIEACKAIPLWHQLNVELVPEHFIGDKPDSLATGNFLLSNWERLSTLIAQWGFEPGTVECLREIVSNPGEMRNDENVICHGDFHRGNIAFRQGELILLDWEHVHRNHPFWDLYHLLDMTHPRFRRTITMQLRLSALTAYLDRRIAMGWEGHAASFLRDYHKYAAIHSAWMMMLIQSDLEKESWPLSDLLAAKEETIQSLADCLRYLEVD